ncbi:MAG: type II toxin-antitoxin system RelE/ParE family toxin [Firmicutes bacterium]|nr:type II toxin-antitoxin system RelE/ParE family toxin [Bacillota bacterium]
MKVELLANAKKYLNKLNDPQYSRILRALGSLENEPPTGDIKAMSGSTNEYRLRVGDYRILFRITDIITVTTIATRGQVYKKR